MDITFVEEKENLFFKRKDLKLDIKHIGVSTPSKSEITKELVAKYGVDESQVQINYIFSKKGIGESFVNAKILKEKPKVEIKQEQKSEINETPASATE